MTVQTPSLFDAYSLRARLQPALLCILPLSGALIALSPDLLEPIRAGIVIGASMGGTLLLSHLSRDMGKRLEAKLFQEWGGKPSVTLLRHTDQTVDVLTKRRYTEYLGRSLGIPWPKVEDEGADGKAADAVYASAGAWLIAQTRDTSRFRVLFEENISYGFRRNLLALKPLTAGASVLTLAVMGLAHRGLLPFEDRGDAWLLALGSLVALYLLIMLVVVRPAWAKEAAVSYAQRLLETADLLAQGRAAKQEEPLA